MRKIYAASWKLFTLTAEADRVLCQLVMFLTVFFHWMYKMKYSCYQESSVIHGWFKFVYWVFGWEMCRLSEFGNPISDGIVFVFHFHHMLVNCTEINSFWEKNNLLVESSKRRLLPCRWIKHTLWLLPRRQKTLIFNYFILPGKRHIFTQRFEQKTPNIDLYGNLSCAHYKF